MRIAIGEAQYDYDLWMMEIGLYELTGRHTRCSRWHAAGSMQQRTMPCGGRDSKDRRGRAPAGH